MGIDVDFEYIYKEDRDKYVTFLSKLRRKLKTRNLILTTAIAPKISDSQKGILYEGHDYEGIGNYTDYITLMTYEWGNTNSDPMAVAPINQVEKVLQYGVKKIPSNKILMGIPNYGYSFYEPKVKKASTISNTYALQKASEVNAKLEFDNTSKTPYYTYYEGNQKRVVYFEDARSIDAKLNLVDSYNLGGISIWTIMRYFKQMYTLIEERYNIMKVV